MKTKMLVGVGFIVILLTVFFWYNMVQPDAHRRYNLHVWKMPEFSMKIEYFEIEPEQSGFTANLFQYLRVTGNNTDVRECPIGIGGSYKSLQLLWNAKDKVFRLDGRLGGQKSNKTLAVLSLDSGICLGTDQISWHDEDLDPAQLRLKQMIVVGGGWQIIQPE